jgi:hypothetical protein
MEEVISRFPHIAEICFEELDNYNLIQCKVISQSWKNFIEESKFSYIRLIAATTNCSKKEVEKIFPKANLEETMRLASDVTKVYNELLKVKIYDPSLTLFHLAAKHGYLSVCQVLINGTEEKHHKCCNHIQTPLHYAAEYGHFSICLLIIEARHKEIIPTTCDIKGNFPLHKAAKNGHLSICELLISWIEKRYENAFPAVAKNNFGSTPLHLAAENGHLSVCQFLVGKVRKLKNIRKGNKDGITPLSLAARNGHSAVCHLIIESIVDKRDINNGDKWRQTPLHFAAKNNLTSVCQELMEIDPAHWSKLTLIPLLIWRTFNHSRRWEMIKEL